MNWFTWALLSAVFAAMTAILAKLGVEGINSNVATAIRTTVVLLFSWGVSVPALRAAGLAHVTGRTWAFLIASGFATGFSWLCYFRALQLGKASQVAAIDKLSVPMTILLAIMLLGERLTLRESVGVGLMVTGALVLAWR